MKKIAILALAASAAAANAAVLFQDTFETYTAGSSLSGLSAPGGFTWFTTGSGIKASSVRGNPGKSASRDWAVAGAYAWVDTPFDSTTSSDKVVVGSVDQYIEAGSTLNLDEFTAGLDMYTFAVDFVGSMRVDSALGEISIIGLQGIGFYLPQTAPLDQWNKVETVVDFDSMMARCRLNNQYIGAGISIDQTDFNDVDLVQAKYFTPNSPARAFQDNFKIESMTGAAAGLTKISGTVTLADWTLTPDFWFMHVGVVNPATGALVDDFFAVPDAVGNWKGNTAVANGNYDLYIKAGTWLSKKIGAINVTGAAISGQNATLTNGDVNSDDLVDIGDYSQLAAAFDALLDEDSDPGNGNQSSANWDAAADLNGDGVVDIADYSVLAAAFDAIGDAEAIGVTL
ncbi:MAG: hypothetical protein JNJ45_05245 [Chthonomonas sp.]|nr:hypothetical protein [Chthonomonas sp.]